MDSGPQTTTSRLHKWNVSYHEAVAIQNLLRGNIDFSPLSRTAKIVAGADVAYDKRSDRLFAAIVVLRIRPFETLEQVVVEGKATFPYIPGLLSFREAPVVMKAFEKLSVRPDVLMCDGQGVAHPRGFGLASHLGVLLDVPTIGCAKNRLCGTHREVGPDAGNYVSLKLEGKTIGSVVRTRAGVKPVYVSVGHRIDLPGAIRLVLRCSRGYRIPEPTRQAHLLVNRQRKMALSDI
jgi:deoxyribonuclease V